MTKVDTVTSRDGTKIAFDRSGDGPSVVIVCGGPVDRSTHTELAQLLSERFTVFNYDRRGRGDSADAESYSVDLEFEDLAAVIDAAGGAAHLFGSSGGGIVSLEAAVRGLKVDRMVVWEPPYIIPGSRPPVPADYADRLRALLAEGRRGDMVELFLTAAAGIPAEFLAAIRQFPGWAQQEAVAHTLIYDATIVGDFSLPADRLATVPVPTLVVDGGTTPWLSQGADAVATALPQASRRTLAGQQHNVDAVAIAPIITEFLAGEG